MSVQQLLEGQYKLIQSIGNGGTGHTFIARDINNPSLPQCVVRHFKPSSNRPDFIEKVRYFFGKQVEKLKRLGTHDQIPQLISSFEKENQFFVVQEFIEGQSLGKEIKAVSSKHQSQNQLVLDDQDLGESNPSSQNIDNLQRDKCFSEIEVIKILMDVLNVLEFIHSEGVIHYDIQPDNLIRRKKDKKIMLINLGALQEMQDPSSQLKLDEKGEPYFTVTIGTPGYTSSEQCAGRPTASSDIYALGMVAIKALTGYNPIDLIIDPETGELIWRDKAQVSNGLANVLTRMVRYHYTQRYQSAKEVIQELVKVTKEIERENKAITARMLSTKYQLDPMTDDAQSRRYRSNTPTVIKPNSLILFGVLITVVAAISAFILPIILRQKLANKTNPSETIVQTPNTAPLATVPLAEPSQQPPSSPNPESSGGNVNKVLNLAPNQETVLSNTIQANGIHTYTFQARNGQSINTTVKGNNVSMSVLDARGIPLIGADNIPSANILLPQDGAYIIQVKGVSSSEVSTYQLNVDLKDLSLPKVTTTPPSAPINSTNLVASPVPAPSAAPAPSAVPTPSATPTSSEPEAPPIVIKVKK